MTNSTGRTIQIDEAVVREHLGELVRGTVEETLNAMQPLELGPDGSDALFGLVQSLRRRNASELPISAILEAGEGKDRVEFLSAIVEFCAPPDESDRREKGTNKVEDAVRTTVPFLAVEEYPIEAPPFRRLARVVNQLPVVQHSRDVRSGAALA